MQTKILDYQIVISPDEQTGTGKAGYTAFCPTLGVADDGDTIEEAITNITGAIESYVESLIEDKLPVPTDKPEKNLITTTRIHVSEHAQFA